ncbi:hypothetical protein J1N35_041364, partial [Gossypium stocksii]
YIFWGTNVPHILHLHADIDVNLNTDACTITDDDTDVDTDADTIPVIDTSVDAQVNDDYLNFLTPYGYTLIISQTPTASLFYRGGLSAQLSSRGVEDIKKDDRDKVKGGDQDKDDGGDKKDHEVGGEDEDEKDDGHDLMEEPTPVVVHKNPTRTSQLSPCANTRLDYANDLFLIYLM